MSSKKARGNAALSRPAPRQKYDPHPRNNGRSPPPSTKKVLCKPAKTCFLSPTSLFSFPSCPPLCGCLILTLCCPRMSDGAYPPTWQKEIHIHRCRLYGLEADDFFDRLKILFPHCFSLRYTFFTRTHLFLFLYLLAIRSSFAPLSSL